ncbi:helix-turn-helix domain-containing protein [Candidatus Omnitrophota bacterium]
MNLGKTIRRIRKDQNLTLQELSNRSGVALATLSRIENNRMSGTLTSLKDVATAFGLRLSDLIKEAERKK